MKDYQIPEQLLKQCSHYPYGKVPAHSCNQCIANWCRTVGEEEIRDAMNHFRSILRNVAADRFEQELKHKVRMSKLNKKG